MVGREEQLARGTSGERRTSLLRIEPGDEGLVALRQRVRPSEGNSSGPCGGHRHSHDRRGVEVAIGAQLVLWKLLEYVCVDNCLGPVVRRPPNSR